MLVIPGSQDKATCDGMTRRELLRIGGSAMLGLSLADIFALKAQTSEPGSTTQGSGPGWNRARSVIMIYLQGGPSHLDLWDPKPDAPERVRSIFAPINTRLTGTSVSELLPRIAQINDKTTMIRTMSYTPIGL